MTRLATLLRRSLALRCPRCGVGRLFSGLTRTLPACPACGLATSPEPGFFVGAIYLNYGATALLGLVLFLLVLRSLSTSATLALLAVYSVAFPLAFFRHSRSLWLAAHTYRALREPEPDARVPATPGRPADGDANGRGD